MKHTYEFLRECHGLRFRATLFGKQEEGIIKVGEDGITLCYGAKDPGRMFIFERTKTLSFTEQTFGILPNDFEIVPRDPETYQDWQVGDIACEEAHRNARCEVIFRSGELVFFKDWNNCATNPFTCSEAFRKFGFRLVLTDIEKQIIEEGKKYEPQDGDIVAWKDKDDEDDDGDFAITIYRGNHRGYFTMFINGKSMGDNKYDSTLDMNIVRPATDEERQKLFDAMAKKGKRWNAEKKVVEDIKPEDDEAADVQKMISDALKGYIPKGDIEGFPMEVIEKMLERQYEQSVVVDVSVFEDDRSAGKALSGFTWRDTEEGFNFWENVIMKRDFSEFYKRYPKAEAPGAGMPSFERFDPVLVRDRDNEGWHPMVFSRKEGDKFYVLSVLGGFVYYNQCIPLDKDTEKLIGKTEQYYEQ